MATTGARRSIHHHPGSRREGLCSKSSAERLHRLGARADVSDARVLQHLLEQRVRRDVLGVRAKLLGVERRLLQRSAASTASSSAIGAGPSNGSGGEGGGEGTPLVKFLEDRSSYLPSSSGSLGRPDGAAVVGVLVGHALPNFSAQHEHGVDGGQVVGVLSAGPRAEPVEYRVANEDNWRGEEEHGDKPPPSAFETSIAAIALQAEV